MSTPVGRAILQTLKNFKSRKWFSADIESLAVLVADQYQVRNEIVDGGVVTEGTGSSSSVLAIDMTALKAILKGRMMAAIAAQDDTDLFTTSGAVARATYTTAGADASGISLANPSTAKIALIVCNTDGAGGATETDNGTPKLLAIVSGSGTTLGTSFPTSQQIQDALAAAAGVHDGVTGWAHVCDIAWARTGNATWTVTVTMNRNNVVTAT